MRAFSSWVAGSTNVVGGIVTTSAGNRASETRPASFASVPKASCVRRENAASTDLVSRSVKRATAAARIKAATAAATKRRTRTMRLMMGNGATTDSQTDVDSLPQCALNGDENRLISTDD